MITSAQNSKIKLVRALLTRSKSRQKEARVVLEGVRLIDDVIFDQQYPPDFVLYDATLEQTAPPHPLLERLVAANIPLIDVEPKIFADLSETENSQGFLAVIHMPELPILPDASLLVALDGLADPGNVGTILRTAAAAGADGVLVLPGTVDAFNPKTLRAGMGAHFRLPMEAMTWAGFAADYGSGWRVSSAEVNPQAIPYHAADWNQPTILMIGSEAHGISPDARPFVDRAVYIPMASGVESLNASIAAAVILFEIQRGRGRF